MHWDIGLMQYLQDKRAIYSRYSYLKLIGSFSSISIRVVLHVKVRKHIYKELLVKSTF